MGKGITAIFVFLSVAIFLWLGAVALSNRLAGAGIEEATVEDSQFNKLREQIKKEPQRFELRFQLAEALLRGADSGGNAALVMEAAQVYHDILELQPENAQALWGLARLCLENGVFAKAKEYYQRLLIIEPENMALKADYAVALLKSGEPSGASILLEEVISKDEKNFPAQVALALAYRELGRMAQAEEAEKKALLLSPDAEARGRTAQLFREAAQR